jgi:hypothetical protein
VSRWSGDGRSLFLARAGGWPCEIHRLDLATEKVGLWKQAAPPDPTGMMFCDGILPSAEGRSYVYAEVAAGWQTARPSGRRTIERHVDVQPVGKSYRKIR